MVCCCQKDCWGLIGCDGPTGAQFNYLEDYQCSAFVTIKSIFFFNKVFSVGVHKTLMFLLI